MTEIYVYYNIDIMCRDMTVYNQRMLYFQFLLLKWQYKNFMWRMVFMCVCYMYVYCGFVDMVLI